MPISELLFAVNDSWAGRKRPHAHFDYIRLFTTKVVHSIFLRSLLPQHRVYCFMSQLLLLGAGFSRNWGGLLADDFFGSLIGLREIREDDYVKGLLWKFKNSGGFERALAEAQRAYMRDTTKFAEHLQRLQSAISQILKRMNDAFFQLTGMEFQQHRERMLRSFLFRFDAIFTLNQDILLEHHYCRRGDLVDANNWSATQLPGMRPIRSKECLHDPSWGREIWVPLDSAEFQIGRDQQPIFKLHGSSNWRNTENGPLLVIGDQKSHGIASNAVLAWYFQKFREYLSGPNAKLFVIGYGFKDSHVNEAIINSVKKCGLRFFVVDPLGSDVAKC